MDTLYRTVLKPVLFLGSPDAVHAAFVAIGEFSGRFSLLRKFFALLYGYRGPDISKTVDGITYRTPVLLSAGFDTDGRLTRILPSLSFGGEEVGSITAQTCAGNPRPRLRRLVRNKSIIVNKGLRNKGVDALIAKLQHDSWISDVHKKSAFVIGISIARTNEPEAPPTSKRALPIMSLHSRSSSNLARAIITPSTFPAPTLIQVRRSSSQRSSRGFCRACAKSHVRSRCI